MKRTPMPPRKQRIARRKPLPKIRRDRKARLNERNFGPWAKEFLL